MTARPLTILSLCLPLALSATSACATTPTPGSTVPMSETPSTPPAPHATIVSDRLDGDVREVKLSNGLLVLLKEDHSAPVGTLVVYYRVGSRNEVTGVTGSSHLLEHLLFKGSAKFKGTGTIMGELSRIGASFNATTYYDRTNYYATVPIDQLPFVVRLEADRMRTASFTDADRASEMTVVRNELERGENSPHRVLGQAVWAASIVSHPYHHPVIGWRNDVENMPTDRIRAYYDRYYHPDNAIVTVVGDINSDETLALLVKEFGIHPGGHTFDPVYTQEEPQRGEKRVTIRKPGELGVVQLGWRLPRATDADVPALKVLQLVLSGSLNLSESGEPMASGISNRLYQTLVDKQLCTGAWMDYTLMIDPVVGSIGCTLRPGVEHATVEAAIREQVRKLRDDLVSPEELERAKKRAKAAYFLAMDGTFGQASNLGYFALLGDWTLGRAFPDKLASVTAEEIRTVAKKWFDDDGVTVGWFVPIKATPKVAAGGGDAKPATGPAKLFEQDDFAAAEEVRNRAVAATSAAGGSSGGFAPKKKTLANGMVVVVQENPSTPTFAMSGAMLAGSVHETDKEIGLAGMTAGMLDRGTKRANKLQVAARLEEIGASRWFGDGFETVSFGGYGLATDFETVLDVLAEEMKEPAFPEDELTKLKAQRIARVQQAEDSTSTKARRALMQTIYPKSHPLYELDAAESIAGLEAVTRARVLEWYERFYGTDRMYVTVVGNVKAERVFELLERHFGTWRKVGGPRVDIGPTPRVPAGERLVTLVPDKASVDVMIGHTFEMNRLHPDYYAAWLGNHVLGGGVSGRLFKVVRGAMGLTYGIGSGFSNGRVPGSLTVSLTLNPVNVEKGLAATRQVFEEWVEKGVTQEELSASQQSLAGLFQVSLATNGGLANTLLTYEVLGLGAEFAREHPKRIAAVTVEQVNAAIRKYFHPGSLVTSIAGTIPEASAP